MSLTCYDRPTEFTSISDLSSYLYTNYSGNKRFNATGSFYKSKSSSVPNAVYGQINAISYQTVFPNTIAMHLTQLNFTETGTTDSITETLQAVPNTFTLIDNIIS